MKREKETSRMPAETPESRLARFAGQASNQGTFLEVS
jgi:hypothetical protein